MKTSILKSIIREEIGKILGPAKSDRYERIVFMQGDDAVDPLQILDADGEDKAIEYLSQWHEPGNHEMDSELSRGDSDNHYESGPYILSWNSRIGYIGLEYDTYYDKYKELFDLARNKSGMGLDAYEKYLKDNFDDYLLPHIQDFIRRSTSFDDFIKLMNRFESHRHNEYRK